MTAFRGEADISDFGAAFIAEKLIYAVVKSSSGSPWEVFSGTYPIYDEAQQSSDLVQLSTHLVSTAALNMNVAQSFRCKARSDGALLDSVFFKPSTITISKPALPTIVMIHGGPYGRTTHSWDPMAIYNWLATLIAGG